MDDETADVLQSRPLSSFFREVFGSESAYRHQLGVVREVEAEEMVDAIERWMNQEG